MFSNLARPPTASSASFGLKPVAVTLMVISAGAAGDGTVAVGTALPHAATLNVRTQTTAIRQEGTTPWPVDLPTFCGPGPTNQNLRRTAN